jgi:hypothetical protein
MLSWFRSPPKPPLKPYDFSKNLYPAHTSWPPNFADLTQKEQFRFERKFKRRSKLKWARPIWNRNLALLQWGMMITVVGYCVFGLDWENGNEADTQSRWVSNVQNWYRGMAGSLWTTASGKNSVEFVREKERQMAIQKELGEQEEA